MIIELLLNLLAGLVENTIGGVQPVTVPDWLDTSGVIGRIFAGVGSLGVWVPIQLITIVLGTVLTVWVVGFGIRVVRIVASFLTLGGGA